MKNKVLFLRGPLNRQSLEVEVDHNGKPKERDLRINSVSYLRSFCWLNGNVIWFYSFRK